MTILDLDEYQFPSNNFNEQLANIAMNHVDDAIMITDKYNQIMYVNRKFQKITGYTFEDVRGKTPKSLQSGIQELSFYERMKEEVKKTGKWQGELWNRRKNGEIYLQSLSIIAIKNEYGKIENFIGIFSNLFQSKVVESENLQNISYYDSLTSLPKRALF